MIKQRVAVLLLFIALCPSWALAGYSPQTIITDANSGSTLVVTASGEAMVVGANAAVEAGGHLQSINALLNQLTTGSSTISSNQTSGSQETKVVDASGSIVTSTLVGVKQSLDVNPTALPPGASIAANQTAIDADIVSFRTANHSDVTAPEPRETQDGVGNKITSQASASQRALDVGIDVSGLQVDPRQVRALTSSDVVTAGQGSATAVLSGAWPVKTTDGVNVITVKAASAAAVPADTSQVVALSPNSPLPPGSNVVGALFPNQSVNLSQVGGSPVSNDGNAGVQAVGGDIASGSADSGNPVKVGGVYTALPPLLSTGQRGNFRIDSLANLFVTTAGYYTNVNTATTVVIKTTPGILLSVCLNTKVSSGDTLTVYDNTVAAPPLVASITINGPNPVGACSRYDVYFSTGLTIVTSSTDDWTISWR